MSRERPRVLLVDDDATITEITAFRLKLLGYEVHCAQNGEEAFAAIEQELPDAIVLEMRLPGMDGCEVATRLSNDEKTTDIPIIAFTSETDPVEMKRAYAAGAEEYVVKPYDPAVLQRKLEKLLEGVDSSN